MTQQPWSPDSWKQYPAGQQVQYADPAAYQAALQRIGDYPPLVFPGEVDQLKRHIAKAGRGEAFILQGGNCAERFIDCTATTITNQLKILLQMSVILTYGVRKPVIRIGRIAGQYAKPRSRPTETVGDQTLPSYRGDNVNAFEFEPQARQADPDRLMLGLYHSAVTLNYIRAMIDGGFADLHHPYTWNLHRIEKTSRWPQYKEIVEQILNAIDFMESFGGARAETLGRIEFYTSHEGLLLGYEQALTHRDQQSGRYYNLGAHMLWIGERTRDPGGAHVEYFRGIANPIGVKIGPTCTAEELLRIIETLNPDNEAGRLTLITRLGADRVEQVLPALIEAVKRQGRTVTFSCDPMHGNADATDDHVKTRNFDVILQELETTFRIHAEHGTRLAGVHFELTGEDVTECIGGAENLTDSDLQRNYQTYCDPRLNYSQSLEMTFLIVKLLQSLH